MLQEISVQAPRQGLHDITDAVDEAIRESGRAHGLCTLFCRHTSASLVIQEGADPSVLRDLEAWMARAVPEGDPRYEHTLEGPDDPPSHIRAALTCVSLAIPFRDSRLALGTWQRVFLWEHRRPPRRRTVILHLSD